MYSLNELSDALYGLEFRHLQAFQQKAVTTFFAGQIATETLAALRGLKCPECGHKLAEHVDQHGCQVERRDIQVAEVGAMAQGPCGCTCEALPDFQMAIAILRKVAA